MKLYQMTKIIRKVYGLFVHTGVLYYARKVQSYWKKVFILSYRNVVKSGHDTTRFLSFLLNKVIDSRPLVMLLAAEGNATRGRR